VAVPSNPNLKQDEKETAINIFFIIPVHSNYYSIWTYAVNNYFLKYFQTAILKIISEYEVLLNSGTTFIQIESTLWNIIIEIELKRLKSISDINPFLTAK